MRALSRFVGVGNVFAQIVDGDARPHLIHSSSHADSVRDFFAGHETGGSALPNAGALRYSAQRSALRERDKGSPQHVVPDGCAFGPCDFGLPETFIIIRRIAA